MAVVQVAVVVQILSVPAAWQGGRALDPMRLVLQGEKCDAAWELRL
jgi:hypothetical protein